MSIASAISVIVVSLFFAPPADPELEARRVEATLLNRKVDLGGLRAWQIRAGTFAKVPPPVPEHLLVLQLWAVECPPCIAEMPMLRDITRSFKKTEPRVRFAYVSETLEEDKLLGFLVQHAADMPDAEVVYQISGGRLRRMLGTGRQPITLLVDHNLVVRQAFVGSIAARRNELVDAIERVLSSLPQPSEEASR